jgi:hypothetical protein
MDGADVRFCSLAMIVALVAIGGCSQYVMKDIKIVDANEKLGYDVVPVCNTCQARGKCGNRNDSLVWADNHARATGHTTFTRQACSSGLTPVLRGPEEHTPPVLTGPEGAVKEDWSSEKTELKNGMTLAEARTAMGDVGHTESETMGDAVVRRTIRFHQTGKGANAGSSRNLWADFENGKLTAVKYGEWEK